MLGPDTRASTVLKRARCFDPGDLFQSKFKVSSDERVGALQRVGMRGLQVAPVPGALTEDKSLVYTGDITIVLPSIQEVTRMPLVHVGTRHVQHSLHATVWIVQQLMLSRSR